MGQSPANGYPVRRDRDEKLDAPVVLVNWYDWTKWLLERVESFPKNQRFVFGQRLADRAIRVLEILVNASYRPRKAELLAEANRNIEVLRWLVRLAKDRQLLSVRQYGFACKGLTECGRMVGGWLKQAAAKEGAGAPAGDRVASPSTGRTLPEYPTPATARMGESASRGAASRVRVNAGNHDKGGKDAPASPPF